ncbi:MAG: AAA family ATPase [Bacteroidales bacterium]|nr:AAA family ATPase [Bacteroidales bacterium]
MNLLNNIRIKNFRGFDDLQIEGFNKINLFIGRNNSGKSSVLEAIFLLIGMSNPLLPNTLNRLRGLNIKNADEFKYLFHKLKFNNNPEFECSFSDTSIRKLKLNPIYKKTTGSEGHNTKKTTDDFSIDASTALSKVTGLELEFSLKHRHNSKKPYKSSMTFNPPEIIQELNKTYKEESHAVYITGNSNETNALYRYSEIVKRKRGEIILEALRKIDSKIESIQALPDGIFFSYKDIEELIPIHIAGDGVRKYINIVTTIAEKENSIVLIDEIENGLHYSAHKSLWESIITISKEFNIQLFITSHSIETLKCLKELLEESKYKNYQDKLSVFKISHTKKSGIKTYKYSYKGFRDAIETETEIR